MTPADVTRELGLEERADWLLRRSQAVLSRRPRPPQQPRPRGAEPQAGPAHPDPLLQWRLLRAPPGRSRDPSREAPCLGSRDPRDAQRRRPCLGSRDPPEAPGPTRSRSHDPLRRETRPGSRDARDAPRREPSWGSRDSHDARQPPRGGCQEVPWGTAVGHDGAVGQQEPGPWILCWQRWTPPKIWGGC
ncbi:serine/arginine repetitive matrix protein 1-like isoform X2 [Caloenas nicobarica]|uniref:serine/arginine repetitive matrix protein 1-like isoform X2 n=1 Tax=Caloenas nicobarica TaxID=187106 RepID=UPI0032B85E87